MIINETFHRMCMYICNTLVLIIQGQYTPLRACIVLLLLTTNVLWLQPLSTVLSTLVSTVAHAGT